ncbi:microtubule-actin cross-linking factor 1, isoforms 1/2/3/5-like isoform X11 [Haliotis rufescens]|uniref:microtubule-actin cross-linking factor 1, isoforms 1/2/3/5-like isoform X11 n=1 Tax=Haliotis rufescens TaxID=6454 RepID=UPI00201F3A93|nr:microtubule-actin cross-linking factor 1, isoforms 1/2/3/5-like isoform X11 [Haliotis rufescens]
MDRSPYHCKDFYQFQEDYESLPLCVLQLDPADRAVIRIADQRDAVQKKTFTKWVNKHLLKAGRRIVDLYEDLRDGHNLISLLEVLAHEILPREKGHMRFHKIQNVQISLEFLKMKGIRLVNIRSDEIVDGNPKLTLGLIWTVILHFQISEVVVPGQSEDITARDALLLWSRRHVEGYPGVQIRDFSRSWRDGKAFLAIAHRHRPDLVDFRKARHCSNKQNLETAFRLYEREYGVTRLLDPEDLDVPDPDDKSVLTYVSSLYDVFPQVPTVEQSLRDNERQLKVEEYRDLATALLSWLTPTTNMMLDRSFPGNLMELKNLLADFNRFRLEDFPERMEQRKKLLKLWEEIQQLSTDSAHPGIEEEFSPDNINRLWSRFVSAQQERDMALQAEILRLERLQRVAEKVHRESKLNEDTLVDLERKVAEEERRVDVIHPFEAKRSCDAIDRSIKTIEDNIRNLFRDIHSLQDGRYPQADQIYRRVSDLQTRVSQLRTQLYSNVVQRLLSRSYVEEGRTITKRKEVITEVRMVDTNPAFKHLQDCLDWIEEKQQSLESAEYDNELSRIQALLQAHQRVHQEILGFRAQVDKCIADRRSLSGEEQKLYTQTLSKAEVAYSLLTNTSVRRQKCLESLHDFIQVATAELVWLGHKEGEETARDWGSRNINVGEVDEQHRGLVRQLESRESQFNAVQERGGAMILDRHPAAKTVEAYMATLQSQWSWLLELTACLEQHLKHATAHQQFFEEGQECEQWMMRQTEHLQKRYARKMLPGEEAEHLLRELEEMQDRLHDYERHISSLVVRSHEVVPLLQRNRPVFNPVRIRSICTYHQEELSFQRGEECVLLSNSDALKWKVRTAVGMESTVPSVCFIIPPPNQEAVDYANRLKSQLEKLLSLCRTQQRNMRKGMVLATIEIVKGWDLKQFRALDPSQRVAIWQALRQDAEKLLAECGDSDPQMAKLRQDLQECNQIFLNLSSQAAADESKLSQSASQSFLQQLEQVNRNLGQCDQQLSTLLNKPIHNNTDAVHRSLTSHQEFDRDLLSSERDVDRLQQTYQNITPKTSQIESRLNLVVQKCDQLKAISQIYVDRMKSAMLVVSSLDEVKQLVSDYEITLASHDNMTSDTQGLRNTKEELVDLQSSIQTKQPHVDSLKREVLKLRALTEHSRPGVMQHHDVESLEKDVDEVTGRWDNVCIQVVERLRSMDTSSDLASLYHNGLTGEQQWVGQMQARIESQPLLSDNVDHVKQQLEPTMSIYNSLGERRHQIEAVNRHGGQYIREAKGRLADSYEKLMQDLHNEQNRISDFEQLLKEDQQMGDEAYKVQSQLEAHKAVHEEIVSHQQRMLSLVYQAEQLTEHYQEELTPEQVVEIQTMAAQLKKSLSKVVKSSETRLKHLSTALEELTKYETEHNKFLVWLTGAEKELDRQEECMQRFEDLKPLADKQKSLLSDIVTHQADLRFMSMTSQKYMEEAKLHKLEVDAFKADRQRPARLSLISMEGLAAETVKDDLKETQTRYQDLKGKCGNFGERLSDLANKQRDYNDVAFKLLQWLTKAEDNLMSNKQESGSPDPNRLHDQLEKLKSLRTDAIAQSGVVDDLERKGRNLTNGLSGISADPQQLGKMQDTLKDITGRYESLNKDIDDQTKSLQTAITKSQGVKEAVGGLLNWMKDAEKVMKKQHAISLNPDNIQEQMQEFRAVESDILNHKSSIDSIKQGALDLIKTCDLEMARALESQVEDIDKQYATIQKKVEVRGRDLEDVSAKLKKFQDELKDSNQWIVANIDNMESKDFNKMPSEEMKSELEKVANQKNRRAGLVSDLKKLGDSLVKDPRTGEVTSMKDSLAELERNWDDLTVLLADKEREAEQKEKQDNEFENAKTLILLWLAAIESQLDTFEPVAVDIETVERQIAELQPMLEEFEGHGEKVDEINDLGNALEMMQSPTERPLSPFRRINSRRRLGLYSSRLRTPSPTFPTSPTTLATSPLSSESSGVSSRKSSSDNLLLDDLSETQQQLLDINQRYDIVGERLADRQQELNTVLASIKTFLQDLQDMLTWLDMKDGDISKQVASIPTNEKEAKRKLKDHEAFHRELLGKEGLVEDIRKKAQHLLKTKPGVPGLDTLQSQISQLDDKWHGLRATSEQRRKSLEDMVSHLRSLRENGDLLNKWLTQKEKMLDVLGPVATEPALIQTQLDQVKVLHEEFTSQEPLYDQFIHAGHSILDKCDPESRDAATISRKMDTISKAWEKLQSRLNERQSSLSAMEGIGSEFAQKTSMLQNWGHDFHNRLDSLPPVSPYPEKQSRQADEMIQLAEEMIEQTPVLTRTKELCKQLSEKTKDSATKADLRAKLARVEKTLADAEKKMDARNDALEVAGKEGQKFTADCKENLAWINEASRRLRNQQPLSGDQNVLKKQADDHKVLLQDITAQEPEIRDLLDKGQKILEKSSPTMDTRNIADTLDQIQSEWKDLQDSAKDKEQDLAEAKAHAQKYQDSLDKMLMWMDMSDDKLKKTQPDKLEKDTVGRKLKELQALQNDVLKKTHDHDHLNREGEALMECVKDGRQNVRNQLDDLNNRWEHLNSGITERSQSLEDLQQRLAEIQDNMADATGNLLKWENKLESHLALGQISKDPKYLDKIKNLQEDVGGLQDQLDYLDALVEGVSLEASDEPDTAELKASVDKVRGRQDALQENLNELLGDMETGSQVVGQFQGQLRTVAGEMSDLENELKKMAPVARDEHTLDAQKQDLQDYQTQLDNMGEALQDLEGQSDDLLRAGYVSDPDMLRTQLANLKNQHDRLSHQARQRAADIDANQDKVKNVNENLKRLRKGMDVSANVLESLKPVGGDVGLIKEQQDELKNVVRKDIEPLQKQFDVVTSEGQSLIQSVPPGVDTSELETDLEVLADKWSQLNEKVSDRERSLDSALLQSGKFNDALDSLLSWLSETEDMVANQKPPSPEFRVVKAQLQEQKFLQKMLEDRWPSVNNLKDTADTLQSTVDPKEKKKIQKQMGDLDARWGALAKKAGERMGMLEDVVNLAKDFQGITEPLTSWLTEGEKKFAQLEPKALDAEGIKKLVKELKQLQDEIDDKDDDVHSLASKGKSLQDYCKGDDVVFIQKKIDDGQKRYGDLRNKVEDILEQMEEALPLAEKFHDAHTKLLDWFSKVEPEARSKDAVGQDAEEHVQVLMDQLEEIEPILEVLNSEGNDLADLAPGDSGLRIEDLISKDNKRFDNVKDQIAKKAEKVQLSRQKSNEVVNALDDLLEWFDEEEGKLLECKAISSDPSVLQPQLVEQKTMNDDINSQKSKARDAIALGKKLLRENSVEEDGAIREKMDLLKQRSDGLSRMSNDRLTQLEQALPLSKHFTDTHADLVSWMEEIEPSLAELEKPSIDMEQVKKQQEMIKALRQDVTDQKPMCDRLNKTGNALLQICGQGDAGKVQDILDDDNRRMEEIRNGVRERSHSIDAAMQQSAEFTDQLEDMLETMTTTNEQVQNAEPISAFPDKLRDQIAENKDIIGDIDMREKALEKVKVTAEELLKQAGDTQDDAVKDVKEKLDELIKLFDDIKTSTKDRGENLEDTLDVSEKFWDDLNNLMGTLNELQSNIKTQEPPALEPEAIREQQEELEALKEDIQATAADLDDVRQAGDHLLSMVGDSEKPEVQKNIEDADANMAAISDECEKRSKTLEDALKKAVTFQDELMKMLVWLQRMEERFCDLGPIGSDFETIKKQWDELKIFKADVDPKQIDVETLTQQVNDMVKDSNAEQAAVVKEPLLEVNTRWDTLVAGIGERQRQLQMALLSVGQFDHALDELLSWEEKTDKALDAITPVEGEVKDIEMELAKLKSLQNDITAHQPSVDSLNEEALKLMAADSGESAAKQKVDKMNNRWDDLQDKCSDKQARLETALKEARSFGGDLQDIMMKLGDVENQLITSKPVGGLPETAKEQLEKFMDVYSELQALDPMIKSVIDKGHKLAKKSKRPAQSNLTQNVGALKQRWDHAKNRAEDKKKKLEEAVGLAGNFHTELNKFIAWLTDTEKTLNNLNPVSRLVDRVTKQIDEHRFLQKDVSKHREAMVALDKMGTHLKYFSQKQDVILIKNLLSSAQHRWEKIVSRSAERTRHLERGYKEAKQFHDMWRDLIDWLVEAQSEVDSDQFIANEPDKIKAQIAKHKEFQRKLGSKQPKFDTVNRTGRSLKDRCPKEDSPEIQQMLNDLKSRWNAVCGKSVDRQRKLEEALLTSGQFNDALQALMDWLAKVEPTLGEDQLVHGDIETVNSLLDQHKTFQTELSARTNTVAFVQKSAKELMEKSQEDTSQLQAQLIELSTMWDRTCRLSANKQQRLDQAHKLADEFQKKAQGLVEWLAEAEQTLRYRGPIPDEEPLILQQMDEHKKFEEALMRQEATLRETLNIGQDIMKRCHPDAVSTMKYWLSALRARWEELTSWSRQRGHRLAEGLTHLRKNNALLEELLAWLNSAEVKLHNQDQEPLPEEIPAIMELIREHQDFQNEMSGKQPEVDRLTKAGKRRTSSVSQDGVSSFIPVLKGAYKTPTKSSRLDTPGRKTPDFGRKTPDFSRSYGRKTPDFGRRTPDFGRRTPEPGRKTPEPLYANPRVGALFNKWRQVWLMAMDRQRKLQDALEYQNEVERMKNFDFDEWRKRYLRWMHHNKARIMDLFRRQDRDHDGQVTRKEFIEGIISSKFPTSKLEMNAVADIFDRNRDGYIDYKEFVSALRPDRDPPKPETEADKINDEVKRQVHKCTCMRQYKIHKIGEGKYRFGDSQKLRLVRILRSTVMVRVGGGWIALDEFLVKNDPCRVGLWRRNRFRFMRRFLHHDQSKGRTNIELREQFILAEGVSQSMTGFVPKTPPSSNSGSSTYSGGNNSWSSRSPSTASGPIYKIREKTQHQSPWKRGKTSPDKEVTQIMSRTETPKGRYSKDLRSPRNINSPVSRSSSRASTGTGSRPPSRTGSEASETSEPDVYLTGHAEARSAGGRNTTTPTYPRTLQTPPHTQSHIPTPTKGSKIPKFSPRKK